MSQVLTYVTITFLMYTGHTIKSAWKNAETGMGWARG